MAITRTAWTDDSGGGLDGTVLDNAAKTELYDQIDAVVVPGTAAPTTTGTITAEPLPTGGGDLVTYHNNATLKTIQGMVAGTAGQRWTHVSKGAGQVDFAHAHASGTALGKLNLFATTGLTSLAAGSGVAVFQYDATLTIWRLVSHEQGAYINYTSTSTITGWSSFTTDRKYVMYKLVGRQVFVSVYLDGTSNATTVRFTLPFVAATLTNHGFGGALFEAVNNGAYVAVIGTYNLPSASSTVDCYASAAQAAWTASAAKSVKGELWYETP